MRLTWAEHLSVGNGLIDSDHQKLIVVVNDMEHAIGTKDHAGLTKAFDLFTTHMLIHFINEEKIAAAINFPFVQIKQERLQFGHLIKYLNPDNALWAKDLVGYVEFLSDWMLDRIMREDMQMKSALETYPYNFKPD
ncbi:MAG TPA: hemerythrin family protein [Gallionella sp.]|nr:hemerythrin family protein [Gallionella sp.]